MHQDFVNENTCDALVGKEQVCELFSFEFDLYIKGESVDNSHRLVLSQDTKKLMVVIDDNVFCIYTREDPGA